MYQLTAVHQRPSTIVEFYSQTGEDAESVNFREHWENVYKKTGKLVSLNQTLSSDGLTMTTTMLWDSEASYNEAMADPIVAAKWAIRTTYNNANNIIHVSKTTDTI